jgi:CHAT domain-containing protein
MRHTTTGLLFVIIITIFHNRALSQEPESARSVYRAGELIAPIDPNKSFLLLEKAMNLSKQNKDWKLYASAINKLAGLDLEGNGEKEKKIFLWLKEAVEILKDSQEGDALARLHFYTAEFYNRLTIEINSPISHYQTAKRIWTELNGEWSEDVSNCYHGLGNIYKYYKFNFHEAEKCYEKALLIREKIHFKDSSVLYKNYYSLAATNRSQRDFDKALSYGAKTLEVANKLERIEMGNGMVANIYRDMGESSLAKKYYLKALALNEKTKDLESRAWYYLCLGETFKNDGLLSEALQYFKKAYALYTTSKVEDQGLFIRLLIKMIDTHSLNNDHVVFTKMVRETFQQLSSLDRLQSREAAEVWLVIGDHYSRSRSYDSAIFFYQKALMASVPSFHSKNFLQNPSEEKIGNSYYVTEILAKKALVLKRIFTKTSDAEYLRQSLSCLKLAEKLLSKQRNTLDMEEAKWQFLNENYDLYEDIISGIYEGQKSLHPDTVNHLVFKYFEQSKARSLADALGETERTTQISSQDSLFQRHAELKRKLFGVQDLINKVLEGKEDSSKISRLREEVINLDQSIQSSKFAIEDKYPGYFNVKYGYRTVPLQEVQKVMQNKKQVLLEYFWGNESVYGLGISDESIYFRRVGSADSINAIVNNLLLHLNEERASMSREFFQSFTSNAHQLHKILVQPFMPLMSKRSRIQIIPDGSISQVPFEILLEEKYDDDQVNYRTLKYMIKSYTIGYAYSSSMLVQKATKRRIVNPKLLGIGFTGDQQLRAADPRLEELEGAEQELEALEKRFATGKFLIGNEATESNFKTLAPDFDIIHLAIHGRGDVQKDFAASLYFRQKYDSLDDGELHAYELYGLKLRALMAVLSSCESGLGKGYKGEGMISMASAFTYSGCENILMSLWKVNDQASTTLMDDFYEELLKGQTIDEALRTSKLNYLGTADELTADPKIWAPLVAYGSLGQVFQNNRNSTLLFIVLSTLLVLSLFLFYKLFKK